VDNTLWRDVALGQITVLLWCFWFWLPGAHQLEELIKVVTK